MCHVFWQRLVSLLWASLGDGHRLLMAPYGYSGHPECSRASTNSSRAPARPLGSLAASQRPRADFEKLPRVDAAQASGSRFSRKRLSISRIFEFGAFEGYEGDSNRISSGADVACSRPCRSNRKAQGLPGSPVMIVIHRGGHLGVLPITPSRLWGTGAPKGPRNCSAKKRNTSTRILLFKKIRVYMVSWIYSDIRIWTGVTPNAQSGPSAGKMVLASRIQKYWASVLI